jgi:methylated-DNA-[protein]-cysteine S-methyltransferase
MTDDLERELRASAAAAALPDLTALSAGVAERAQAEGLLDVAYAHVDSPLGPLLVAATDRGLVRLSYITYSSEEDVLAGLAAGVSPRLMELPARLDGVRRELDEYFAGDRREFSVALDWTLTHGFARKVLQATARVPFGEVTTYKGVAGKAGSPRAVRAAGNALGSNPIPVIVPCHRVLRTGGGIGGYTGGVDKKEKLLALEGSLPG